jgi:hypothetical protein
VDGSLDFQIALVVAELIEQSDALAEKCWDEVDLRSIRGGVRHDAERLLYRPVRAGDEAVQ